MEPQKTINQGLFIPKNTFTRDEWLEIKQYAAKQGITPGELLSRAWRDYRADQPEQEHT